MRKMNSEPVRRRGMLYALMLMLTFLAVLACAFGGLYLYHRNQGFFQAFQHRLAPQFYLSAAFLLLSSSVLYTPFSYGISYYFLCSCRGEARFSAFFFLFRQPLLLLKAILVSIGKKIRIYFERLLILLAAAVAEVTLFFLFLLLTGEDLFGVQEDPFRLAAEFMMRSPALITLSVLLWCGVLFMMILSSLRYILCKYLLLSVRDAGVWQVLKVGKAAIRGHLLYTLFFYLRYIALSILAFFSVNVSPSEPFSAYAERLAMAGWREYCRKRSLR